MNKDIFQGNWHQFKGKVKEKWGKLTDDDLTQINGKKEILIGKLQARYGYAVDQAEREVNEFEKIHLSSYAKGNVNVSKNEFAKSHQSFNAKGGDVNANKMDKQSKNQKQKMK